MSLLKKSSFYLNKVLDSQSTAHYKWIACLLNFACELNSLFTQCQLKQFKYSLYNKFVQINSLIFSNT